MVPVGQETIQTSHPLHLSIFTTILPLTFAIISFINSYLSDDPDENISNETPVPHIVPL